MDRHHKLQSGLVRSCIYVYYKQERPGTEAYFEEIKGWYYMNSHIQGLNVTSGGLSLS